MKYWNINQILPYQRNFNFINGPRSIGKTYTTQKYCLKKCIERKIQFVYLVRTQDEKKDGVLQKAFEKVVQQQFKEFEFDYTDECMYLVDTSKKVKKVVGWCIAISEALKIKKRSFPNVKYIIFDEYMLESKNSTRYVNGWKEPDLFLSIYHTIDREEDRVIAFMLGNNTSFYNPYHMHPAFDIPETPVGCIWLGDNVLFQWAKPSSELSESKTDCKFLKMIGNTGYGKYALNGEYTEDSKNFVEERSKKARHIFYFEFMGAKYGVWYDSNNGIIYIDYKYDPNTKLKYALTLDDHSENTTLTKSKNVSLLKWLGDNFKLGNVRFVNMAIKKQGEKAILLIL